jgi:DNA-binding NtrC family response regulator
MIGIADFRDHVPAQQQTSPVPLTERGSTTGPMTAVTPSDEETLTEARDLAAGPSLREQVEAFERGIISRALEGCGGNQSEAARRLGVSRVTLIDKMKKYGLTSRRT